MSSAADWKKNNDIWRKRFFSQSNCDVCDGQGILTKDMTPPDWWESGPVEREYPCTYCPECSWCRKVITKDEFRESFALRLPDNPVEYSYSDEDTEILERQDIAEWGHEPNDPWHFCTRFCFEQMVYRATNLGSAAYSEADTILFRTFLFESVLSSQQDI